MFKLLTRIPRDIFVAVSGGPDSMAALSFLSRSHNITAVYFNHNTRHGAEAEEFVVDAMKYFGISLITGKIKDEIPEGTSKEDYWRKARYNFFKKVARGKTLVMAHTLDDAMETWLFTSLHGESRLIPAERGLLCKAHPDVAEGNMTLVDFYNKYSVRIIRPFLLTRKAEMLDWCARNGVPYVLDPGNVDLAYARVRIRREIMPEVLKVQPGFSKTIAKKYLRGEEDK